MDTMTDRRYLITNGTRIMIIITTGYTHWENGEALRQEESSCMHLIQTNT